MSERKEPTGWLFFKKAKTKKLSHEAASPGFEEACNGSQHHDVACDTSVGGPVDFKEETPWDSAQNVESFDNDRVPEGLVNNNWIVDNWFKTWPTREKPVAHESQSANLKNFKDLIKSSVISLDVITGSNDTSYILSMLRPKGRQSTPKMSEQGVPEEAPLEDGSFTLDALLESLPLVYNPSTKQLQIGRLKDSQKDSSYLKSYSDKKHIKSSSADAATLKEEANICDEKCTLLDDKSKLNSFNSLQKFATSDEDEKNDPFTTESFQVSCLNTLPRRSTTNSLSFTDASSFSSLTSSNTDISLYSASDSAVCLGRETPLSDNTIPKRKKGFANFLSRNLFSWKVKEEPSDTLDNFQDKRELENIYPSSESLSSTSTGSLGWRIFSRSNAKGKSDDLKAGTVGLIMEDRPSHLPAKTAYEQERHKQEYEDIVSAIKKKELREAKERRKAQAAQMKLEQQVSSSVQMWNKVIIPKWNAMHKQKKCRDLWWLGIPSCTRGKVWKLAIGNDLSITPPLYSLLVQRSVEKLVKLTKSESEKTVEEPISDSGDQEATIDLIRLDVSRTFPHLCIFQKGGPYHDPLHNILGAYVCYRPDVGYVQGMSFLAATLLLNMDESEAFIAFANLLNNPVHMAFYSVDQHTMQAYYKTLEELIAENLSELSEHLQKLRVTPDLYFLDWVLTVFSRSLPLDVSARIWDLYLRDGEEFLFQAAVGILKLFDKELKSQECTVMSAQLLTRLPDDVNQDALFRSISSVQTSVNKKSFSQVLHSNIKASSSYKIS